MKNNLFKLICAFVICLLITQNSLAKAPMTAQVESHRIPAGTILKLKTYNAVSTDKSKIDDQFDAMLIEDNKIGKTTVLPTGTLFRGRVIKIEPNKMLSKSAAIYLAFDHVITPAGKLIPVTCGLCGISMNLQGGISDNGNYGSAIKQNWETAVKLTKNSTNWGLQIDNASKYVVTPLAAIGGGTCSTVYFIGDAFVDIFKKGSEVYINQDSVITIMLTKPLDIPIN